MVLTRLEKVAFVALVAMLGTGIFLLIGKAGLAKQKNEKIKIQIASIAAMTDQSVLVKDDANVPGNDNDKKLNLNRADELSIAAIPGLSGVLAKRIADFIKERGTVKSMEELMDVKGMNRKKLRQLETYATVYGGHAGQAAWGEKLNLNFATMQEISSLPGIGPKTANEIVEFRNRNGGFFSLEDLREIPGLTPAKIEKFIEMVDVR